MAVATYPGTVSPLRGLDPFGEAERDVFVGRETEREEVARLVTADGFRAGLVYGEPGVGKTSLVRAGVIPHLRDHGIVALACDDLSQPAASFAAGLSAFGIQPTAGEAAAAFITRAVASAVAGQLFVFVIDDADLLCADERAALELAELFAKVVSRSGGRARFLFVAASERMHALAALERRTGSLFPPSTRYELKRLEPATASKILDRTLSLSGVAADPALADSVVHGISRGQPVLAADIQISATAMRDLKISSAGALADAGGPTELESAWLHAAAAATGNERSALRMCAELAASPAPRPAEHVIRRISLDAAYAQQAFATLEQRGVIVRADAAGDSWMLRHEILAPRVREHTAAARAAARRAYDLLGSKTSTKQRLTLVELRALRTEGIAPVTPEEVAVVARSKRHYMMIAGAIAAVPVVLLIIIYVSMRGRVFLSTAPRSGGDRVVVVSGRAGLSGFSWLPGSGYGKLVADTGLTRTMVAPEAWKNIEDREIGATRGSWDDVLPTLMTPRLAGLVDYAQTGNPAAIQALHTAAKDPEDLAELLVELRPIARGQVAEVGLVEGAAKSEVPTVRGAAIATAGAAAKRHDAYHDLLVDNLASSKSEERRVAIAAVRAMGERGRPLFEEALTKAADGSAQRELSLEISAAKSTTEDGPSAAASVAVLVDPNASGPMKDRALQQIRGALIKDPTATATALADVIGNDKLPAGPREEAIDLLYDMDPPPKVPNLVEAARAAWNSAKAPTVKVKALPLYARVDPVRAGGELAGMLDKLAQMDHPTKVAVAYAWGEIAGTNKDAAANALDRLLKDENDEVRSAAATAAGKVGRQYQDRLFKMAKSENYGVRIGAAMGLARSAEVGANASIAVDGIAQMWNEKGRPRRDAAKIYAHLAKKKPGAVLYYLDFAARNTEDTALHPVGVEGLCNGALAGDPNSRAALNRTYVDPSVEVRRIVMHCVADGPEPAKNGAAIAQHLATDTDGEIRLEAARVLSLAASGKNGKVATTISDALVKLLDDPDHEVRLIAIRAVGGLGTEAPKSTGAAMARMFERADEAEKLALLRASKQIGVQDLVSLGIGDASPLVRVGALDAALGTPRAEGALSAALADSDPTVRRAALERVAKKDLVEKETRERALALAVRDTDPELSQLALTTIARTGDKDVVEKRLRRSLGSRIERERAQAAAAAIGLVDHEPALTVSLLEPLLDDPSHDVRVAMLPALAAAYAKTNDLEKLGDLLRDSEDNAMKRLVAAAAFLTVASTDNGATKTEPVLAKVVESGPPMAAQMAKLVSGLIAGKADGITFLQELVP